MPVYDAPSNRLCFAVQVSFLLQKSRGKVQSALGGPERVDRVSADMFLAARDALEAPDGSDGSDGLLRYCTGTVPYRIGTVPCGRVCIFLETVTPS